MTAEKTTNPIGANPPVIDTVLGDQLNGESAPASGKLTRRQQSRAFADAFQKAPLDAVATLVKNTRGHAVSAEETTAILLPYLVRASYAQQNLVVGALEQIANPEQILNAALALYAETRDPRLLSTADHLLANRGAASWPALKSLCKRAAPECRFFVRTIAEIEGISNEERREALTMLAHNPDLDTRRELLALLDGDVLADPLSVWQVLAKDPDEDVASLAADRIALLGR